MKMELEAAIFLVKSYKVAKEDGLFKLREFDFKYEVIKNLARIAFECLHKNLQFDQVYEILQNYGETTEDKVLHKLAVNGIMCIIDGQNEQYFLELLSSIIGLDQREVFIEEAEKILNVNMNNNNLFNKYISKTPLSENTDILKDRIIEKNKVKNAISKMNAKEIKGILCGVSGKTAEQLIDLMDPYELKIIDEESVDDMSEHDFIKIQVKFLDILENS